MHPDHTFQKASFCHTDSCCVEVARSTDPQALIYVRHSVTPTLQLAFTREEWQAFVCGIKQGEFDLL